MTTELSQYLQKLPVQREQNIEKKHLAYTQYGKGVKPPPHGN